MFHDSELELKAVGKNIFLPALAVTWFLALISAILSSNAIWLISVNCFFLCISYHCFKDSACRAETLCGSFIANAEGYLLLQRSPTATTAGKLSGSQWCSRHMVVLRYTSEGRVGHLVILKIQQKPEQFRQLSVWLRHNSRNEGKQES